MNHSYKKIIVPALLGTLFLGACSDDASFEGEGKQQTYSLVVKGITTSGSDSSEELRDVSVFQFSDGNLYKTQQLTPESQWPVQYFRTQWITAILPHRSDTSGSGRRYYRRRIPQYDHRRRAAQ